MKLKGQKMKKFSEAEDMFIIKNQDYKTLGELAFIFNCHWKDVYNRFDYLIHTKRYKEFTDERREKVNARKVKREKRNDRDEFELEFLGNCTGNRDGDTSDSTNIQDNMGAEYSD